MYKIHMLPASYGDSFLIEYGEDDDPSYILIDGGPYFVFDDEWIHGLREIAPKLTDIELLVVTHIDIDHIDGIVVLLNREKLPFRIHEVWFNGWDQIHQFDKNNDILGPKQGEYLSALIREKRLLHNTSFGGGAVVLDKDNIPKILKLRGGMQITLLSPGQAGLAKLVREWQKVVEEVGDAEVWKKRLEEDSRYEFEPASDLLGELDVEDLQKANPRPDRSAANGSSIAFIGEYDGRRCLFAADAQSDQLDEALGHLRGSPNPDRIEFDAWKLSHHGSKKSTLGFLMRGIDCKKMLISTNGSRYDHPDPETLALLFKENGPGLTFYCNYKQEHTEVWDDEQLKEEYGYEMVFPEDGKLVLTVEI